MNRKRFFAICRGRIIVWKDRDSFLSRAIVRDIGDWDIGAMCKQAPVTTGLLAAEIEEDKHNLDVFRLRLTGRWLKGATSDENIEQRIFVRLRRTLGWLTGVTSDKNTEQRIFEFSCEGSDHPRSKWVEMIRHHIEHHPDKKRAYLVVDSIARHDEPGLSYRQSRQMEDKVDGKFAAWGRTVTGKCEGDWLKLEDGLFLPTTVDGMLVLTPTAEAIENRKTPVPLMDREREAKGAKSSSGPESGSDHEEDPDDKDDDGKTGGDKEEAKAELPQVGDRVQAVEDFTPDDFRGASLSVKIGKKGTVSVIDEYGDFLISFDGAEAKAGVRERCIHKVRVIEATKKKVEEARTADIFHSKNSEEDSNDAQQDILKRTFCPACLLLSDRSQTEGLGVAMPASVVPVELTEVVRSSKRIIAGAIAFQMQTDQRRVDCHHGSQGPPLKSFLFDLQDDNARWAAYSEHVVKALDHISCSFPGLCLHDRVMIVAPDQHFVDGLKPTLQNKFDMGEGTNKLVLKSAIEVASVIIGMDRGRANGSSRHLVLDTVENIDGLERLTGICVGLDEQLGGSDERTRARLYRGLTRAHLMAVVVNHKVHGGWLEFLSRIRIKDERSLAENLFHASAHLHDDRYQAPGKDVFKAKQQLHRTIVDRLCETAAPTDKPWAMFMAGGPGSGKGSVIQWLKDTGIVDSQSVHIDVDRNRLHLDDWKADQAYPKSEETVKKTQPEAGFISELAAFRCCQTKLPFLYDGTLRNAEWNLAFFKALKKILPDLRICICLVDTPLETCKARVKTRCEKTGRPVQDEFVVSCNEAARKSADSLSKEDVVSMYVRISNQYEAPTYAGCANDGTKLLQFTKRKYDQKVEKVKMESLGVQRGAAEVALTASPTAFGSGDKSDADVVKQDHREEQQDHQQQQQQQRRPDNQLVVDNVPTVAGVQIVADQGEQTVVPSASSAEVATDFEQLIWDTSDNSALRSHGPCKFMPFLDSDRVHRIEAALIVSDKKCLDDQLQNFTGDLSTLEDPTSCFDFAAWKEAKLELLEAILQAGARPDFSEPEVRQQIAAYTGADKRRVLYHPGLALECRGHTEHVRSLAALPDGRHLASASDDGTVRVWAAAGSGSGASFEEVACLRGHEGTVWAVAALPSDRLLTGGRDGTARVWAWREGHESLRLEGHGGPVVAVATFPVGERLVTGSEDKTARVWRANDGRELLQLAGHTGGVHAVAVLEDGLRIVTGSWDKTARLWNASDGSQVRVFSGHEYGMVAVALLPDGARLLTGSADGTARLWALGDGTELQELRGHKGVVNAVAAPSDGQSVATGSDDQTVRIWNVADGVELLCLRGHGGPTNGICVLHDGISIASASGEDTGAGLPLLENGLQNGIVRIWGPNLMEEEEAAGSKLAAEIQLWGP